MELVSSLIVVAFAVFAVLPLCFLIAVRPSMSALVGRFQNLLQQHNLEAAEGVLSEIGRRVNGDQSQKSRSLQYIVLLGNATISRRRHQYHDAANRFREALVFADHHLPLNADDQVEVLSGLAVSLLADGQHDAAKVPLERLRELIRAAGETAVPDEDSEPTSEKLTHWRPQQLQNHEIEAICIAVTNDLICPLIDESHYRPAHEFQQMVIDRLESLHDDWDRTLLITGYCHLFFTADGLSDFRAAVAALEKAASLEAMTDATVEIVCRTSVLHFMHTGEADGAVRAIKRFQDWLAASESETESDHWKRQLNVLKAQFLDFRGDHASARELLLQLTADIPSCERSCGEYPALWGALALNHVRYGDTDAALAIIRQISRIGNESPNRTLQLYAHVIEGSCLMLCNRHRPAIDVFRKAKQIGDVIHGVGSLRACEFDLLLATELILCGEEEGHAMLNRVRSVYADAEFPKPMIQLEIRRLEAEALHLKGCHADALILIDQVVEEIREVMLPSSLLLAQALDLKGAILLELNDVQSAVDTVKSSFDIRSGFQRSDQPDRVACEALLHRAQSLR
ncbi:MAG: hypothetical protein R3C49_17890 [Planctomycetaceae bacterium]